MKQVQKARSSSEQSLFSFRKVEEARAAFLRSSERFWIKLGKLLEEARDASEEGRVALGRK